MDGRTQTGEITAIPYHLANNTTRAPGDERSTFEPHVFEERSSSQSEHLQNQNSSLGSVPGKSFEAQPKNPRSNNFSPNVEKDENVQKTNEESLLQQNSSAPTELSQQQENEESLLQQNNSAPTELSQQQQNEIMDKIGHLICSSCNEGFQHPSDIERHSRHQCKNSPCLVDHKTGEPHMTL